MNSGKTQDKLNDIDSLIKSGRLATALTELKKIRFAIPASQRARFARLCRRAGAPELAVRFLNRIVRPVGHEKPQGTAGEQTEYAASLIRLGAKKEGLGLLAGIEALPPEGLLIQAFAHFSEWEYATSIPLLEKYLSNAELTPYEKLVGRANLAAAFIYEHDPRAHTLVDEIYLEAEDKKHTFLLGHIILLRVQQRIVERDFKSAKEILDKASTLFDKEGSNFEKLFIQKWNTVIRLLESPDSKNIEALHDVRSKATKMQHWETIRDCDFWEVVATKNKEKLEYLYFGTPFADYRKRLLEEYGEGAQVEGAYLLELGEPTDNAKEIDWLKPDTSGHAKIPRGGVLHNALLVLLSDFYRPFRIVRLFSGLYPDQYFSPTSDPTRIHQLLRRLRKVLNEVGSPLKVVESSQQYRLESEPGSRIWVPEERESQDEYSHLMSILQEAFRTRQFSAAEASKELGIASWTVRRVLRKAAEKGALSKTAKGRSTRYKFQASKTKGKKVA